MFTPKRQYSVTQRERFAQLKLLIIDEISTMDSGFLGMADAALRQLNSKPDRCFGGINVLLVGDWLQQLPVAGMPAFKAPIPETVLGKIKKAEVSKYLDRIRGHQAYRAINYVVVLDENMRHRRDPVWRDILNRWRVGNFREEDIALVNVTCFRLTWSPSTDEGTYCPIIVTSNTLRSEFNHKCAIAFCKSRHQVLHEFSVVVTRGKGQCLTPSERHNLDWIRDDKTANLALCLRIAIGMPVQCSKNVCLSLMLANGTIAQVVAIQPSLEDVSQDLEDDGVTFRTHSSPPEIIFVQITEHAGRVFAPELPPGFVPIRPWKDNSVDVQMPDRQFRIRIQQVPLVPAFSLTTEKCQGLTVHRMVLAPLRHHTRRCPQKSSFYVAVTRVTAMSELYLTQPLTLQYLRYFTPDNLKEAGRASSPRTVRR